MLVPAAEAKFGLVLLSDEAYQDSRCIDYHRRVAFAVASFPGLK
jgi:hypothetical protein